MQTVTLLSLLSAVGAASAETVLGVYIFSRHGDRTSKSTPPTVLTDLGYQEVYTSGTYYRNRYIASGASNQIYGMNTDVVKQSQITVSSPYDDVLALSAQGFLQGLYPPVGTTLGSETLHNGTVINTPLDGYQLIPVESTSTGSSSESSSWLQGSSNCENAVLSSNEFYSSTEYLDLLNSTMSFYQSLSPLLNSTFTSSQMSYKNAYTIFDYLNVASIDNGTFPSESLLTDDVLFQLRTLADSHEFALAFNNTDPIRAITGATIGAQVVTALNGTITGKGKNKLNIQFGAYGGMQSYFGLTNLTEVNVDFYGVPDYASTLVWELVTNASNVTTFPSSDELSVRFLFHNGTTSNSSEPVAYPLFGGSSTVITWDDFVTNTNKFAISGQTKWCEACGNSTGVCSPEVLGTSTSSSSSSSTSSSASASASSHHSGMSNAVAGVIGAFVTLAVVLGLEILILLVGGLRVVSKRRLVGANTAAAPSAATEPKA